MLPRRAWDEAGMRSRARGRLTEVSWHLESSFLSFSVFLSPQDRLERDKHSSGHYHCFSSGGRVWNPASVSSAQRAVPLSAPDSPRTVAERAWGRRLWSDQREVPKQPLCPSNLHPSSAHHPSVRLSIHPLFPTVSSFVSLFYV